MTEDGGGRGALFSGSAGLWSAAQVAGKLGRRTLLQFAESRSDIPPSRC